MRSLIRPLSLTVALLTLLPTVSAGALQAASPADELLRFVPIDVTFCAVARDLRGHSANLLASPFWREFKKTNLAVTLARSAELAQVEKAEKFFENHLGLSFAQLRDDILGDAVVLAYRSGPPGKPEQEQGLLLVRARTAQALSNLVEKVNKAQKDSGELKELAEREHRGVKYVRRVENKAAGKTAEAFYLLRGPVLVFTSQESFLRQAIERDKLLGKDADPPLTTRLAELGLKDCPVALVVNPRAFDAHLAAREARPGDPRAKAFEAIWKAVEGIGVGLRLDKDVSLSLVVRARLDDLPAPTRRSLARAGKVSELWKHFPEDPLLAVSGRTDFTALFDFLGSFMSKESQKSFHADLHRSIGAALGKDVLKEVLPALGPDWGIWVTAPPADARSWAPRALAAVRVSSHSAEDSDPVDQALLSALNSWAVLAVLAHNKLNPDNPIRLKSAILDRVKVKYLSGSGAFPPGVEPAMALKGGYLLLGSSPDVIRRFPGPAITLSTTGGAPVLRISFKAWRTYLKERRDDLAAVLATREKISRAGALARLDGLRDSLAMIDTLELREKIDGGQMTLTLVVQPAHALRK
jgi:hypothetical protein